MATHLLRVVWPVLDESRFDHELIAEAARDWPRQLRHWRATQAGRTELRIVDLTDQQQQGLHASRAVLGEAPVTT